MNGPSTDDDATRTTTLAACVSAFASAVKNLTIYPKTHPRVTAKADEFAQQFAAGEAGSQELVCQGDELRSGGKAIAKDHVAVRWLAQRCRETGVRAIAIDRGCDHEDVVRFAEALITCRPGSGRSVPQCWQHDDARIRPIELVVGEHRAADGAADPNAAPPPDSENVVSGISKGLAEDLRRISQRPSVKSLIDSIVQAEIEARDDDDDDDEPMDLLGMIGRLIPADGPTDFDELADTIEDILSRTLGDVMELVRSDSHVRSADLMNSAVQVARNYFARPDAQQLEPEQRPQGRPGDEKFQPDVQALLDEIAQLPPADDVRLPPNDELAAGSPAMVRELLGICLYGLTIERDPEQRELRLRWIERLCAEHPEACRAVLDAYLTDQGGLAQNARLELLHELLAAGLDELVRQYDYVDDALLRSGFPEVLGTAAAAFRSERDYARLRAALDDLSAVLDNGGDQAAGETGNLDDPAVLTLLARTGGRRALGLLGHSRDAAALRQVMLACARELELPDIERLALELHAAPKLPAGYLQRVLHACGRDDFSGPARATSGELLCAYIDENLRAMPAEKLAAAIEALEQAPTPMTRRCLKRLSRIGRFSFSSELRAVRQLASQVLARIERRTSK